MEQLGDAHDASPSAAIATTKHRRNISIRSLLFFMAKYPDAQVVKDTCRLCATQNTQAA
jgi:hypothetical protein